jgi:hypothetical protein
MVKIVGVPNVAVEGAGVVLGEQIDLSVTGMDAITYGYVDEAALSPDGHGRLAASFGEGKQPTALSTSHNYALHF